MKTGRSRIPVRAYATLGAAQTIAIDFTVPFNCTLLQFSIDYSATPNAADTIQISKISGADARISPIFRIFLNGANGWANIICNEYFELMKNDRLIITAGNGDDLDVGAEAILQEGG